MSSPGLRILAVDDEQSAREDLARLLRSSDSVAEVRCADGGRDALAELTSANPDAIFLDVRMPGLGGLDLARVLRRFETPPHVVFVSAYEEAAVDAFELRALDYLLKPVSRRRLEETLLRVATAVAADGGEAVSTSDGVGDDMIAVANSRGGAVRLLSRSSILYVQSYGDFVRVVSPEGRFLLRITLGELERRWRSYGFVRVHRQYVANLRRAVEVRPQLGGTAELAFPDGQTVPVARRQVSELTHRLHLKDAARPRQDRELTPRLRRAPP